VPENEEREVLSSLWRWLLLDFQSLLLLEEAVVVVVVVVPTLYSGEPPGCHGCRCSLGRSLLLL
jgi:hypothetical protein